MKRKNLSTVYSRKVIEYGIYLHNKIYDNTLLHAYLGRRVTLTSTGEGWDVTAFDGTFICYLKESDASKIASVKILKHKNWGGMKAMRLK